MIDPRIIPPADQKVGFVELFFDLVFVFSVTQVVGLLHHEPAATAILAFEASPSLPGAAARTRVGWVEQRGRRV